LQATVTALLLTRSSTPGTFPPRTSVASFPWISDRVSTIWHDTVGLAFTGGIGGGFLITLLILVLDSISANRECAVGSAMIWFILVIRSLIALLNSVWAVALSPVISTLAFESEGESWKDFGEKRIITIGSAVVQHGNGGILGSPSVSEFEEQLNFKVGISVVDCVLTWGVEHNSGQMIVLLVPSESSSSAGSGH